MKKLIILLLIGMVLVAFSTASALDLKGKFAVSGNGGLMVPVGDLADKEKGAAKTGFGVYGTAEYFITDNIGVGGFVGYYSVGTDNEAMKGVLLRQNGIPADELDITQKGFGFGAFGKYLFDLHEKAAPYVKAGVGMVKPKFSGTATVSAMGLDGDIDGDYDSQFLIFGGGGLLYRVSPNVGLNFEALFLHGMTKDGKGEITMGDLTLPDEIFFDMQTLQISAAVFIFFGPK
jgi:opacity protein-like surface antigen